MLMDCRDQLAHRDYKASKDLLALLEYRDLLDHKVGGAIPDLKEKWVHQVLPAPRPIPEDEPEEKHHQTVMNSLPTTELSCVESQ